MSPVCVFTRVFAFRLFKHALVAGAVLLLAFHMRAQVAFTGGTYAQNFDGLASRGGNNVWENNKTLPGWSAMFLKSGRAPEAYRADGGGNSVGVVSFGGETSRDRALGVRTSANAGDLALGLQLRNSTGAVITSFTITFDGEQWRDDGELPATLSFAYKINGGLNSGTDGWVAVRALDFATRKNTTARQPIDGNDAANRAAGMSANIPVHVAPGDEVWFRWLAKGIRSNAHAFGIDNFKLTATTAAPGEARPAAAAQADARPQIPPAPENDPFWPKDGAFPGRGNPVQGGVFKNLNHMLRTAFAERREAEQGALVFAGDSITERWRTLADDFAGLGVKIANRGIGGDRTRNLLYRLQDDVLSLHPCGMVLLIGTNDLGAMDAADDIAANLREILALVRKYNATLPIALCLVMPRREDRDFPRRIPELNRVLEDIAKADKYITLCDTYTPFSQADGTSIPDYFNDRLHPNAAGYAKMRDLILPVVRGWNLADRAGQGGLRGAFQPFVDKGACAGLTLLVANAEKILATEAVGYADLERKTPMRPDSFFWIASMTKPMTAACVLMLADEGRLSLDDPVSKYIPEFNNIKIRPSNKNDPPRSPAHAPTIRELLSNSSGLVMWVPEENGALDRFPLSRLVQLYAATELLFEPGTGYSYSNAGFNTAGRIIEIVSGMSYESFMQKRLLDPLGMSDTTFWPGESQLARLATGYKAGPDGLVPVEKITLLNYPLGDRQNRHPIPGGGLFSTATDCARFGMMLVGKGAYKGKRILSENAVSEMTRRQTAPDVKTSYGFGLNVVKGACWHGGAYGTDLSFWPEKKTVSVFMVQKSGREWGTPDGAKILQLFRQMTAEIGTN